MKKIIFILSMLFVSALFVSADESQKELNRLEKSDTHMYIEINVDQSNACVPGTGEGKCSVEGKMKFTTEDGDSIEIEFKVTAGSCKEARKVLNKILDAFDEQ